MIALSLLAATLAAAPLPQADRDDLHCLAYLSVAAGAVQGDLQAKVDAGAIYYFGRLEARSPQLDIAAELDRIVHAPGYAATSYQADKQRCHRQLDPLAAEFAQWRGQYAGTKP